MCVGGIGVAINANVLQVLEKVQVESSLAVVGGVDDVLKINARILSIIQELYLEGIL